jgi:DNA-binding GntR family transcriptional regulator
MISVLHSPIADPVYMRVRELIRQDIFTGHFAPGARIPTAALSARYGVSQMPIREALQQLQGEGLVIIAPNRGARVRHVDARFISNIYDIRAALDAMMVARAVETIGDNDMFTLYAAERRFEEAASRGDIEAALAANREFHESIFPLAGNPEAVDVIARHAELFQSLRRRFGYSQDRMQAIITEHRQLLRAFEQRDPEAAARAVKAHNEHAKLDLIAQAGLAASGAEKQA